MAASEPRGVQSDANTHDNALFVPSEPAEEQAAAQQPTLFSTVQLLEELRQQVQQVCLTRHQELVQVANSSWSEACRKQG